MGIAVGIGYLLKSGLNFIEQTINADIIAQANSGAAEAIKAYKADKLRILVKSFPTFPLCMVGGLLVQIWEQKFDKHKLMDLGLTRRIQNSALDFLVVPAIAMISIKALIPALAPFAILIAAGIAWKHILCGISRQTNVARRMVRTIHRRNGANPWASHPQALLLLRVVDPDYETPAADAFAYKQIMHEPIMGGGLWTSTAIPLLWAWGGLPVFGIACGAVAIWLGLTFLTPLIPRK